ncbi:MAG: CaiB/BaiF CoA transferase family protein [Acidimicrobiales bacterium]
MLIGESANTDGADEAKPLAGVRVLAAEQMAALPFATQLLARLGADVVKVEHPEGGESGRGSVPGITDPDGRHVGATFLRSNLNKRSITLDLKADEGRELFLRLAPKFDIVCENFKAGTADRLGIGYDAVRDVHPSVIYLSVSGFGQDPRSPYVHRAAYAAIVEGMSGIYEYKRAPGRPPTANPVGALGDISSALFGVVGVLAALRHRDNTGHGQRVDIAMLDATVAMTDLVTNFYSMGIANEQECGVGIVETFAARDGHFVLQVVREHHFAVLADAIGHPEWVTDERFLSRSGWMEHLDDVIRPGIEAWAADKTAVEAVQILSTEGMAAGESLDSAQVASDPHLEVRNMLIEMPRPAGDGDPVLIPGNPVKLSRMADGDEARVPWLGEHTDRLLAAELGLDDEEIAALRGRGIVD